MSALANLFADAAPPERGERFDVVLRHRNLVVERIVSSDVITPTPYEQAQDEWVVLLQGEADLEVSGTRHTLRPGDHVFLPAGTPHTVLRTAAGTVWLAVHLHPCPHD